MVKEYDVFEDKYAVKSSTDVASKPTEIKIEEKEQNKTVTGHLGYYDRMKPYRYYIKAKVIK